MTDPRLTLESIVGKAIEIADSDGLSGVSMRKIADALGVGAMSLYRHVADKDALLVEMTAEVTRRFAYPDEMMGVPDWRARVRVAVEHDFDLYSTHPWVLLAYAVPRNGMQPETLVCFDWLLEAFGHLGVAAPEAAELTFQVWSYSQGWASVRSADNSFRPAPAQTSRACLNSSRATPRCRNLHGWPPSWDWEICPR